MKKLKNLFTAIFFLFAISVLNAQTDSKFVFTCSPVLQNMQTTGVTLFWEVNKNCKSWVEYGESEKLGQLGGSFHNGMADIAIGIQKVKLENLKPSTGYFYRVASCEVKTLEPYKVVYGDTIFSKVYAFSTPGRDDKTFSFLAFNDIHDAPQYIENVVKNEKDFDFAVFNGDIFTDLNDEADFAGKIFSPLSAYFASGKPSYFIRGNHETRGGAARSFYKYFDSPTGNFYYTFTRGNTFFIMLDCGEDKPDNNKNYYGLADYDKYRSQEAVWLENVVKSPGFKKAKFKIVCIHMPITLKPGADSEAGHGVYDCSIKFAPILNKAGVDLLLCGHTHKYEIIKPGKETNKFPVIVGGAYYDPKNPVRVAYTKVEITPRRITAILKNVNSGELEKIVINK